MKNVIILLHNDGMGYTKPVGLFTDISFAAKYAMDYVRKNWKNAPHFPSPMDFSQFENRFIENYKNGIYEHVWLRTEGFYAKARSLDPTIDICEE